MKNPHRFLWLIIILTVLSAILDLPKDYLLKFSIGKFKVDQKISSPNIDFSFGGIKIFREIDTHLGLDLRGGTHLVLEADMSNISKNDRGTALESARNVIDRRVNFLGVTEPVVQSAKIGDSYRVIVEMPGIKDVNTAISLLGQTAFLDFREQGATPSGKEATLAARLFGPFTKETGLTGRDLKKSQVTFNPNSGKPEVALEFTPEGGKLFAEITKRNVNQRVAIFLDNQIVSDPRVNEPILDGRAVITGDFTVDEAKKLSIQLNAGALPTPIKIVEERTIGATLGEESVQKSARAGVIGLLLVAGFMLANYGRLGLLADFALIVYGLLTLVIFRLIPVTLTLPGIAGFILSVGMAVDSNILIFERIKEEISWGKHLAVALELGFGRAWDSIRDANFTTLITCFILFNPLNWTFLPSFGMVRGFALTLAVGVLISLFTGIIVTRTLVRVFYRPKI